MFSVPKNNLELVSMNRIFLFDKKLKAKNEKLNQHFAFKLKFCYFRFNEKLYCI